MFLTNKPYQAYHQNTTLNTLFLCLIALITSVMSYAQNDNTMTKTLLFMEDEIQNINVTQVHAGNYYSMDVKSEIATIRIDEEYGLQKRKKLEYVLKKMDSIDHITTNIIQYIDQLKIKLLKNAGENINTVIQKNNNGLFPNRLELYNLISPSKNVIIEDSIQLYRSIIKYSDSIIYHCSNYNLGSKSYYFTNTLPITDYSGYEEFNKLLNEKFDVKTYNYMEDKNTLMDIYVQLHNATLKTINQRNSTLLTNLCLLSVLQQDILKSRTLAIIHWKSKVSTGLFNFDSVQAMIEGPEIITSGNTYEYKVFFAAINSDNTPEITISSPENVIVKGNENGVHTIQLSPKQTGKINLSGTLIITDKSGIKRTENWEKTIEIK